MILIDEHVKNALHKVFGVDKNVCQASIAKSTGIQQSSISRWISGVTKHMGDDNWLKIFPHIKEFLPENYNPKDTHGRNKIFLTHNYHNVKLVSQGDHAQIDGSANDPLEVVLIKYFRNLSSESEKLKAITIIQEMTSKIQQEKN